ncbi:uncharacterized protein B0J16DRAFT_406283 [Fusarium flagelliforme]|uniref:uncharacterized protein n=1 Tax=Fusarium flagelliforme TaxID=2675880 RepID=UPI001E8CC919|nr:uncharacterized protein B0J16DRAFT_406283 [Fusarium flagelliforme]KAH7173900.1 hypothetical protein B0J16DRAFT_406283 [Fusarium flagelliforme]
MTQSTGRIHWTSPCSIVVLFLSGILAALAHHLYYQSLDRQPITRIPQEWAIRIGTGLAFLSKACLGASAALAYQQYSWTILRSRALTFKSIDNVMGLLSDPTCFLSARTNRHAFSCVLIAVAIWCIPLCAIAPPASLTVGDFTSEETIRGDVPLIDWGKFSYTPSNGLGGFNDSSQDTYRTVIAALYTNTVLPMTPEYQNSSYSLKFDGPRLRCGSVVNQTLFDELNVAGILPSNITTTWYNATVDPPGDYRYNIFVATSYRNFSCQVWNTTYTVDFKFTNGIQKSNITKVRHLHSLRPERDGEMELGWGKNPAIVGYAGWYKALTSILGSYVARRNGAYPTYDISSKVLQTALVACPEIRDALTNIPANSRGRCPGGSMERAFERLSEQATLSLFPSIPAV